MAGIKERLIQVVLRGKDELSAEATKGAEALDELRAVGEELQEALGNAEGASRLADQLDNTRTMADRAQSAYAKAQEEVEALRRELDAAPSSKGIEAALKGAQQNSREAAREVRKLTAELEKSPGDAGVTAALRQAERYADEAGAEVARLRDELDRAPTNARLIQALKEAERNARALGREQDRLREAEGKQADAAQAAGIDTARLADEQQRLESAVADAKEAIKSNSSALDEMRSGAAALARGLVELEQSERKKAQAEVEDARRTREAAKRAADATREHASRVSAAREAMSSGMRTVLGFAAAYVSLDAALGLASRGVDAIRAGIGNMLSAGDNAEALQSRMTSLMGSIAAGEQATAWISEFAKQTPLATSEVADAFMLLKSYGLDPMDGTLQALVDKNEQLGGGMDRLTGITTAVGQAFAKSKLQTEEILQLVERGVPAWDLLARVTGKNAAELEKLASEGRLGRDVIAALVAELGKSADGAAAEGMSRLSGLMSQLSDTAGDFYKRIANAGALDFVKGKLQGVLDKIGEMDKNGRLDKLAKALSDAFIQGAEKVEVFAKSLAGVDFKRLIDDGSAWLSSFGQQIDDAATRTQLFFAPFRTLFNWLGTGFNALALSFSGFVEGIVAGLQQVAKLVPDMFGGKELRAGLAEFRSALDSMQEGFVAQVEQNNRDVRNAWDTTNAHLTKGSQDAAAAQVAAAAVAKDAWQQAAEAGMVSNDQMREAIVQAAIDGTNAIDNMAEALELIDTANTVGQLDGLKAALFNAWQEGRISLEEYHTAHNATVEKIRATKAEAEGLAASMDKNAEAVRNLKAEQSDLLEQYLKGSITLEEYQAKHNATAEAIRKLGPAATSAAGGISDLEDKLGSLADIQQAIASAKTDVDINAIKAALKKLYEDGKITAAQYTEEVERVTAKQKELKGAVEQTASAGQQAGEQLTKSQQMYNAALEDSILTNEELRRISGQRMEEERRASGELMEMQRKGQVETQRDMSAMEDFFGGVVTRAREPLAAMSAAALEAYDKLRGINNVSVGIDTSGLEATRASLAGVSAELDQVQLALGNPMISALGKWQLETSRASLQVQESYLGQKASLQELMDSYAAGNLTLGQFISRAEGAASRMNLLDDSDLSSLKSALASARQQMDALGESSRNTLDSLRGELDQLRGDEEAAEARRFASRERDLRAQIEEAKAAGNSDAVGDLKRALDVLKQIESESKRQRSEQEKAAQSAPAPQQDPARQSPQPPATVIKLQAPGGRAVDVSVPQGQQTQLLDILAESGLRTT